VAEWSPLTGIDLSPVESLAETVESASNTVAGFLTAVAAALRVIAAFLLPDSDIITAILNATIDTLEAMILDILQTNAALAFHVNMTWNPEWVWDIETVPYDRRRGVPNWTEARDLPWKATGLDGWLLDIAASAQNEADPFRPLTDSETMVAGFIYVLGVPSFDNIGDITELLDALTDFSDAKEIFDQAKLDGPAQTRALMRAKSALYSEAVHLWVKSPNSVKDAIQMALGDEFDETINDWSFKPGSFPKWMSIPMARIFPPIHALLERLRAVVDALRMPGGNPLEELAELLAKKAEILAELAIEVGDIIQQLLALATLLEGGNFIWIQVGPLDAGDPDSATGGMNNFIAEALAGDNKPDLGSEAIFGGIVGVVTADNPINHLQSFFDLIGVTVSEHTDGQDTRRAQVEDTIDEVTSHF